MVRTRPERLALSPAVVMVALYLGRVARTGETTFGFLLWNVALAAVHAVLALLAFRGARDRAEGRTVALLAVWLLFLPNAPYVVTDFVHLRARTAPLWYDVALLGSAALAGLALGAVSLARVHTIVARWAGRRAALGAIAVACLASGYGIHLGRFARLNSWDVLIDPLAVAQHALQPIADPLAHPRAWGVTVVFAAITAASYAAALGLEASAARPDAPKR
jgi:uncharacterized membrane protein